MSDQNVRVGFLDKLGENENARFQKRAELAREYEEFKKLEEQKFRNRFSDKKKGHFASNKETTEKAECKTSEELVNEENYKERDEKSTCTRLNESESSHSMPLFHTDPTILKSFEDRITRLTEKIDMLYEKRQTNYSSESAPEKRNRYNISSFCNSIM